MKRIAAILLMIFYLIPALGFSITTHFCAGELTDVSLYAQDAAKCACGSEKMGSDCCSTNTTIVKIKDIQNKDTSVQINFVKNLIKLFYSFPSITSYLNQIPKTDLTAFGSPPDFCIDNPIYILNRVFRI